MNDTKQTVFKSLAPEAVADKIDRGEEVFVVDVRDPRQFHKGHIPDAILLPTDEFADRYHRELDADDEVILVCEHGRNSEAAAKYLLSQGFTNVATMAGGMDAWNGPLAGVA